GSGGTSTVATIHSGALAGSARPARCQLVVIEGPDAGRAALIGEQLTVGTDESCGLRLSDDRVSRQHLSVAPDGGRLLARVPGSPTGRLCEGSLFTGLRVPAGSTLKLGRSFVRIQPEPQPIEVVPSQARRFGELWAESLAMRELFAVLELAAGSDVTVL